MSFSILFYTCKKIFFQKQKFSELIKPWFLQGDEIHDSDKTWFFFVFIVIFVVIVHGHVQIIPLNQELDKREYFREHLT